MDTEWNYDTIESWLCFVISCREAQKRNTLLTTISAFESYITRILVLPILVLWALKWLLTGLWPADLTMASCSVPFQGLGYNISAKKLFFDICVWDQLAGHHIIWGIIETHPGQITIWRSCFCACSRLATVCIGVLLISVEMCFCCLVWSMSMSAGMKIKPSCRHAIHMRRFGSLIRRLLRKLRLVLKLSSVMILISRYSSQIHLSSVFPLAPVLLY